MVGWTKLGAILGSQPIEFAQGVAVVAVSTIAVNWPCDFVCDASCHRL